MSKSKHNPRMNQVIVFKNSSRRKKKRKKKRKQWNHRKSI